MKTKKVKAAGRYGARYGSSVRTKIAEIESLQRKQQNCIFCNGKVKRLSKGIWLCQRCGKKFASHTYFIAKKEETNESANLNKLKINNKI